MPGRRAGSGGVSDTAFRKPEFALASRGVTRELGAYVVSACFDRAGARCAFALGDGTVHLAPIAARAEAWPSVAVHDGGLLACAPDALPGGFVTGGDDGAFRRVGPDGTVAEIARPGSRWVEHVASHAEERGRGLLACAIGKAVHLFDAEGAPLKTVQHPSSVTGLAFDAKGKRIAASHYNGASLWFVAARTDTPRVLEWKGSHTGVAVSPDGDAVVTSMQENALHGWRLSDGQHMRMSGYPAKTRSMSFSRNGRWLATSGADALVLWPFFGGGPMGKAPTELSGGDGVMCAAVAFNPRHEAVAGGFADGLVVLADPGTSRILPVAPSGRGEVTALAWSPDGAFLAIGTAEGFAAIVDFTAKA
jgi:WD40 repeat protein